MPEGDTVFRAARAMNQALAGQVLTKTEFRVPKLAAADLAGQRVVEVAPVGKHMLTRTDGGWTLRTHFKMEGVWRIYRPGDRWRGPGHAIRVVLETEPWVAVGYWLAMVELIRTGDEADLVGYLGPDILGSRFDVADAARRLAVVPDVTIGEALLDQRLICGIGNLYKNESLFLRGVHPYRKVCEVDDLEALVDMARRLMTLNKSHPEQATTGNRRGGYEWWVMERPGKPCRRCGTLIEMGDRGKHNRLSYWCPRCQPPPG